MELDRRARLRKALVGFFALLLIAQFARTMAADLLPADPTPVVDSASPAPTDQPLPTDSPAPSPTDAAPSPTEAPAPLPTDSATPTDSPAPSASPSASPTPTPPHAIADQSMFIRVPSVVNVDPRATSVYLPQIYVAGPANLLACVSSGDVAFDVGGQNQTDPSKGVLVAGDQTPFLRTSGAGSSPISILNSANGLRAISLNQRLPGKFITLSFVALSEPSLNPALCGSGNPSNTRTIFIQGIGLDINMAKGGITLKK